MMMMLSCSLCILDAGSGGMLEVLINFASASLLSPYFNQQPALL